MGAKLRAWWEQMQKYRRAIGVVVIVLIVVVVIALMIVVVLSNGSGFNGYNKMSELLLNGNLAERTADGQLNPEYKRGCLVARVRTITVLTQLDARRITYVFAFLREAELMSATKDDNAISLGNADLHAVDWSQ